MSFNLYKFKKASYISPGKLLPASGTGFTKSFSFSFDGTGTDRQDLFEKNLEQKPANWHYRTKIVEYQNNSMGYRAPEFDTVDWNNSAVIFGCSHVYGTGVAEDETISYHLEKIINIPVINMGVPGSSIPFSFYNQVSLSELNVTPKAVINLWTAPDRHTFFSDKQSDISAAPQKVGSWSSGKAEQMLHTFWNSSASNGASHSDFLVRAARLLWKNTVYYDCTFFNQPAEIDMLPSPVDYARDCQHPGPVTTLNTAKHIAKNISQQLI